MSLNRSVFIGLALCWPTLLTLIYFQWLHASPSWLQQSVYGVGKSIQFLLPIVFVYWLVPEKISGFKFWQKRRVRCGGEMRVDVGPRSTRQGPSSVTTGLLFGLMVVVAMFAVYYFILPEVILARLRDALQEKVTAQGIDTVARFLAVAVFYTLLHSLLEEYYWRWFVYDELADGVLPITANLISSLGFMAHHVVLVGYFIGWESIWTYLISGSVAVGGVFWAWLFDRPNWPYGFLSCWLSHAVVDAGIFGLGFWVLFNQ